MILLKFKLPTEQNSSLLLVDFISVLVLIC